MDAASQDASAPFWVSWFLLVVGVGVLGLWVVSLPGAFGDGLLTYSR